MRLEFNKDWIFYKVGSNERLGVQLPHDAMLRESRVPDNPSGAAGAYFSGGSYIYEKEFEAPLEWERKHIVFQFEGILQTAVIYLNDQEAGRVYNGYMCKEIVADSFLRYGKSNIIRVEVDNNNQPNSRWYSGAGIYRPVWLNVMEKVGMEFRGVKIKTVSYNPAQIEVMTSTEQGCPEITIYDGEKEVAKARGTKVLLDIPNAKLWSDDSPNLYRCHVKLEKNGTVDFADEVFGIRMLEWSPQGLYVNGVKTLLRGGCIHHDNGLLGACGYEDAEWRKIRIMKKQGFNAVRYSHNPCSQAILEACDAIGMYVIDETWDMWYRHKSKYDYASYFMENYKTDLHEMVEKDFNHPCVIFYSIGNEVSEPASDEGIKLEKDMVEYLHELDPYRVVTAGFNLTIIANAAKGEQLYDGDGGMNASPSADENQMPQMDSAMFNQMAQQIGIGMNHAADSDEADSVITPGIDLLDIAGYNYASGRYPIEGEKHPERIIFGSETFPSDIFVNWEMIKKYPYIVGDFMWTAWDYLGEAGIGAWSDAPDAKGFNNPYPWLLGGAGVINLLGDPDGQALYAKTVWGLSDKPLIAVRPVNTTDEKTMRSIWRGTNAFPAWSWRGCDGKTALVEVYADGTTVELIVNGSVKERKALESMKASFETLYESGDIEAVVYNDSGVEISRNKLSSAKGELNVCILPESEAIAGSLLYVNIDICGENGIVECNADRKMCVSVEGGELLAYGSANPRTEENYLDGAFTTYYGRSQAIIRVGNGSQLVIHIENENTNVEKTIEITNK
ncbi:glycoside hydrolase family 2 TIM barrel-domain containing protein [Anaerobium acetethylicum]|uniref:Uncharacterized protein n=1 Tax=Anaerobium acetethylicum TaxID=1619234 RepID=A0A1D3TX22_9FIRM|nr:glycoside hydrolase family 2 TIM barrel-domain containing protein [Anaerobium acetethylicum]SCP98829.1 protein of unknown function [Anaerobium acetethylicum]